MGFALDRGELASDEKETYFRLEKQRRRERVFKELAWTLEGVGVHADVSGTNFGFDPEGNAVYVDSFCPWSLGMAPDKTHATVLKRCYNPHQCLDRIAQLPTHEQERARHYLYRLEALFLEEERRLQQKFA